MANQKLELTWIGKGQEPAVEPRILLHDPSKDYGDQNTENMLIHGDNLLALKALEQQYAGKVKCIYIDPPYNTGSAFEHYDDNLEHSTWLQLMKVRLDLLKKLLSEDGSIWITLDDSEYHYLKVVCDEIFGRLNYQGTAIWQHSVQTKGYAGKFSLSHNYTMVYSKSCFFKLGLLERTEEHNRNYSNPDNDPKGPWRACDVRNSLVRPNLMYDIVTPCGNIIHHPEKGWRFSKETFEKELKEGKIVFSQDETRIIRKIYLCDQKGRVPETIWLSEEVGNTREANNEIKSLFSNDIFSTPKPERLVERILTLATQKGDLVLDSFLGSGTTAAVAHKMGRRYIGIELGDHCYTHCKPRLDKVIDGEQGGISKAINWQGGGGYKFYELAPTLIVKDKYGNPVFSDQHSPEMLVAAVSKINGYQYAPDAKTFWKQGFCQDNSFIYVTTQYLNGELLDGIASEVGAFEKLLICAPAFDTGLNMRYDNITVRKIPQSVLQKCEFGVDNYNLNIINPPELDEEEWEDA